MTTLPPHTREYSSLSKKEKKKKIGKEKEPQHLRALAGKLNKEINAAHGREGH